jgi:uncharacterized protein YbjT (DUF2867 family)
MSIIVIGGSGLIGTKVVSRLPQKGYEVVAASPKSGVDTVIGEALAEHLRVPGCRRPRELVLVRGQGGFGIVRAQPAGWAGRRRRDASCCAIGGRHQSTSGGEQWQRRYFRAKMVQENLIKSSGISE